MGKLRLPATALLVCGLTLSFTVIIVPQNSLSESPAKTAGIKGSVILADGRRCGHCTMSMSGPSQAYTTRTDDNGDFVQLGIPSAKYAVCVEFPITRQSQCLLLQNPIPVGPPYTLDIDFSRSQSTLGNGQIAGAVLFTDGRPCSTCTVLIEPAGRTYGTETDSQGKFRYLAMLPGQYTLTVKLPDGRSVKGLSTIILAGKSTPTNVDLFDLPDGRVAIKSSIWNQDENKLVPLIIPGEATPNTQQANDTNAVQSNIDRISRGPHQTLPDPRVIPTVSGQSTGWDITNNSKYLLHLYMSGPTTETIQIGPGRV